MAHPLLSNIQTYANLNFRAIDFHNKEKLNHEVHEQLMLYNFFVLRVLRCEKNMIKMDILIIDDFFAASTVKKDVEKFVRSIEIANSAEDALMKVSNNKFDLVLLSISSKAFDGCKLIEQVKSICPDIKIVTMTDRNSRDLELKVRKQGVIFYMITPFNIKVLKDIVDYISSSKEKMQIERLQKFYNEWARL